MRAWNLVCASMVIAAVGISGCDRGDAERPVIPPFGNGGVAGGFACGATPIPPPGGPMGSTGFASVSPHFDPPTVTAEKAPPPISGGTLLTSADGLTLIAADPDRDAVYIIDVATRRLVRRIELSPSDEPGRVVQDKAGMVHVALRGGRGIASFALGAESPVRRREICDLPRGLAYDGAADRLYLACAEGAVVQIEPSTGVATKKLDLGRDLRDVIARGSQLFVTRFRSAELLQIDANDGHVTATYTPPNTQEPFEVVVEDEVVRDASGFCTSAALHTETRMNTISSEVAWRTVDVPGRGVAMLHQRAGGSEVRVSPGGYGGGGSGCVAGIVRGAITVGDDASLSVDLAMNGLFVDIAADPTGSMLAVANPGGWETNSAVVVVQTPIAESVIQGGVPGNGKSEPVVPTAHADVQCQVPIASMGERSGQAIAVSFVSPSLLAVQEREPAAISFYDVLNPQNDPQRLDLKQPSRNDTGHTLFHLTTGAGIACASCHAEANDDGHVWTFEGIGPRRTQNLRGGILGSEPFHWNGDMRDFSMLVDEVFVGRMTAPPPTPAQADALAHWIDRQPVLHAVPVDAAAVTRGQALFESEAVGCNKCHSGARLTNNQSANVGTGALVQVPSLRGVSFRAPFMHDGCARTLSDRFSTCGGGDKHGQTSQLQATQIQDLVAYLESL